MKQVLIAITAVTLVSWAAAQTEAQAAGSASSTTSIQAGQSSANVNSSSSAGADSGTNRNRRQTNVSGAAGADNSATVNGHSLDTKTNETSSLATGTTIPATLSKPVDARKAKPGDEVTAKTTQDVRSTSGVVIPRGSRLVGHVTDAKAKAKGDSESALGIAFDHAVLRNGRQIPLNASIRALAAAANNMSASAGDDNFGNATESTVGGGMSAAPAPRGGGGILGGTANTLGGAANSAGAAVNGAANGAANVSGSAAGALNTTGLGAAGQLTSESQGVVGLNGLQLNSAASNTTQGSVITSTGKDVKLDSGTQMLLQVNQQ
jgi:hypothetical protein